MVKEVVEPLNGALFAGWTWSFQQDAALAHNAKRIQQWLTDHVPDFIFANEWTSGNIVLNPLDSRLWNKLEKVACARGHATLRYLKAYVVNVTREMMLPTVRAAIGN